MRKVIEELLRIIFIYALVMVFYWTGQLIFVTVTFGYYSPPEGYKSGRPAAERLRGYVLMFLSVAVGFAFWLAVFPLLYDLFSYVPS